jgi:hypothetical protein
MNQNGQLNKVLDEVTGTLLSITKVTVIFLSLMVICSIALAFVNEDGTLESESTRIIEKPYIYEYQGQKDRYDVNLLRNDPEVLVSTPNTIKAETSTVKTKKKHKINKDELIVTATIEDDISSVNAKCVTVDDVIKCEW